MRKLLLCLLVLTILFSCKEIEYTPEGPTDVRVQNITNVNFNNLVVTMADTVIHFGNIMPGDTSSYYRFPKAFPKAEITCLIDGHTFTTGSFSDIYMQTLGQHRITYTVYISNIERGELTISNVVYDEPLVLE